MAGRPRRLTGAALVVILLMAARVGHGELQYRATAGTTVGASDNPTVQSGQTTTRNDGFLMARGRLDLRHVGRLASHQIGYGVMGTSWARDSRATSLNHTLRLASDIQFSPVTSMNLGGGATLTRLSLIDTTELADPQALGPRPAGDQTFLGADAGETLSWQWGGKWYLSEGLEGRLYRSVGNTARSVENLSAALTAGLGRLWQRDQAGVRGRAGATSARRLGGEEQTLGAANRSSEFAELLLSWKHDWSGELSHEVAAGAFVLWLDGTRLLPAGLAGVQWRRYASEVALNAGHSAQPNIYLGLAYQRSFVGLRVRLPLDRFETLRLLGAADLERASVPGGPNGSANIISGRLGLRWEPGSVLSFGLDYQYRDQRATAATPGASPFPTLRRQIVMLTVDVQYPPRGSP